MAQLSELHSLANRALQLPGDNSNNPASSNFSGYILKASTIFVTISTISLIGKLSWSWKVRRKLEWHDCNIPNPRLSLKLKYH
jgi:hypothetical protein